MKSSTVPSVPAYVISCRIERLRLVLIGKPFKMRLSKIKCKLGFHDWAFQPKGWDAEFICILCEKTRPLTASELIQWIKLRPGGQFTIVLPEQSIDYKDKEKL